MQTLRWQDWVDVALGLWIMVSPWTIGHVMAGPATPAGVTETAMWNQYVVGIGVVVLAVGALAAFKPWEEWLSLALGGWLLVSPWALGFTESAALMWNAVITGGLVVVFAGWSLTLGTAPRS